ncbi:MAG: dinitrogenase iron-molybdenum cofactor [Desulfobacula sp.]|nr:dinitrogenase iron-molybdenum cofactor [Desulfobacula sp.]
MRIAFPVKENKGLDSLLDEHFGTAKKFLIVDSQTKQIEEKKNRKLTSGESSCKTGVFAKEDLVNAVVTKCMGDGSQRNLTSSGIKVYQAIKDTISENLELIEKKELKLFHIFDFCQNKKNKKEGGCGHQ